MRVEFVRIFAEYVRERGGDVGGLLSPSEAAASHVPLSQLSAFLERAAQQLQDPFLGLHMARAVPRGTFGILEFCARSAPTLREAFGRMARYAALLSKTIAVSFEEISGSGIFEFKVRGQPNGFGRHANECLVCGLIDQTPSLLGRSLEPERFWFEHPRPADVSELVACLRTDAISFGAPANGFSVSAKVLDLPIATSDPALLTVLDRYASQSLEPASTFAEEARAALRRQLKANPQAPTLASTAASLGVGTRTLQRRLAAEGTGFSQALDAVRADLANLYVTRGTHTLSEIAFLLGYTELSPFTRAFKRWTGMAPSAYRERRAK